MYTTQQIDFISAFGHKELTEGCIIFQPEYDYTFKIPEDEGDLMVAMRNGFRWTTILEISESKVGFEILGHPVEWHNVFAKLKEIGYYSKIDTEFCQLTIYKYDTFKEKEIIAFYDCNPCISPMEQPLLIEELLKLK